MGITVIRKGQRKIIYYCNMLSKKFWYHSETWSKFGKMSPTLMTVRAHSLSEHSISSKLKATSSFIIWDCSMSTCDLILYWCIAMVQSDGRLIVLMTVLYPAVLTKRSTCKGRNRLLYHSLPRSSCMSRYAINKCLAFISYVVRLSTSRYGLYKRWDCVWHSAATAIINYDAMTKNT